MLLVFRGRTRLDYRATQSPGETHALAIDISACVLQERERLWKVAKLYADFLKQGLSIVLDELQAIFVEDLKVRYLAIDPRRRSRLAPAVGQPAWRSGRLSSVYEYSPAYPTHVESY